VSVSWLNLYVDFPERAKHRLLLFTVRDADASAFRQAGTKCFGNLISDVPRRNIFPPPDPRMDFQQSYLSQDYDIHGSLRPSLLYYLKVHSEATRMARQKSKVNMPGVAAGKDVAGIPVGDESARERVLALLGGSMMEDTYQVSTAPCSVLSHILALDIGHSSTLIQQ
jgi:hypothetical protein